jgi:hypothetical protein
MNMASAPDIKAVEDAIEALSGARPDRCEMTIHDNGSASRINIMADALRESGSTEGESVEQWWFENKGLLVIDLGASDDE